VAARLSVEGPNEVERAGELPGLRHSGRAAMPPTHPNRDAFPDHTGLTVTA
jgi:hypothetical protein